MNSSKWKIFLSEFSLEFSSELFDTFDFHEEKLNLFLFLWLSYDSYVCVGDWNEKWIQIEGKMDEKEEGKRRRKKEEKRKRKKEEKRKEGKRKEGKRKRRTCEVKEKEEFN